MIPLPNRHRPFILSAWSSCLSGAGEDGSAGDPLVDTSLLMLTPFGHLGWAGCQSILLGWHPLLVVGCMAATYC